LRPRTNTFGAVLRIRHSMSFAIHKYFNDQGFYYIHAPIITAIALALRNISLYPLGKFVIAAAVAVPLTFVLSELVRKIPYVDRVVGPAGR